MNARKEYQRCTKAENDKAGSGEEVLVDYGFMLIGWIRWGQIMWQQKLN